MSSLLTMLVCFSRLRVLAAAVFFGDRGFRARSPVHLRALGEQNKMTNNIDREAMLRVVHYECPGRRSRRLVLRHLLDISEAARRVGHHSIAQVLRFFPVCRRLRTGRVPATCILSCAGGRTLLVVAHVVLYPMDIPVDVAYPYFQCRGGAIAGLDVQVLKTVCALGRETAVCGQIRASQYKVLHFLAKPNVTMILDVAWD